MFNYTCYYPNPRVPLQANLPSRNLPQVQQHPPPNQTSGTAKNQDMPERQDTASIGSLPNEQSGGRQTSPLQNGERQNGKGGRSCESLARCHCGLLHPYQLRDWEEKTRPCPLPPQQHQYHPHCLRD
jgi:hypothetical protein